MPLTNNLKTKVDLPVWEWCRFAPAASTSTSVLATNNINESNYLYYLIGAQLYRYNITTDAWQTLSNNSGLVTATTYIGSEFLKNRGWSGKVIKSTSNTLQIASIGQNLNGYKVKIIAGTGIGQERTITATGNEVIHDTMVTTSGGSSAWIDSAKKWKLNQWVGYGCALKYNGTNGGTNPIYRTILFSDETSVTFFTTDYDSRDNIAYSTIMQAPYSSGISLSALVNIVSQTITVNSPWDILPDSTSVFELNSGQILFLTAAVNGLYLYDILSDRWIVKYTPSTFRDNGNYSNTGDGKLINNSDIINPLISSSPTSATINSLTDSTLTMTKGQWTNFVIKITSGPGNGQERRIISNTSTKFILSRDWDILPTTGSTYIVTSENATWMSLGGRAQLIKHFLNQNLWNTHNIVDYGRVLDMAIIRNSNIWDSIYVSSATRETTGITGVNTTPTVAGTGYSVGDLLTISTGGTLGRVYVENVHPLTGAVLSVSLYTCGTGYSVGTGRATTGGTGTGCTIEITSVGTIGVILTSLQHNLQFNDTFTFAGATESAWNTTYTVIGMRANNSLEVITTATANAVSNYASTTGIICDVTKNWIPNEHVGRLVHYHAGGTTAAFNMAKIISNTENTLCYIDAGSVFTTTRYTILDYDALGEAETYLEPNRISYGYPSSATTSSITNNLMNWVPGSWNNHKILLTNSDGIIREDIVTSNTSSSLNIGRTIALGAGTNTIAYNDNLGVGAYTGLGTSIFSTQGNCAIWTGNRFVAGGSGTNTLAWSNDGITWTGNGATIFTTSCNGIASSGRRIIAVGSGNNTIAWSQQGGISWNSSGLSIFSTQGNDIAWNGSLFVAVGQGTNTIAWSTDTGSFTFVGLGTSIFSTAGRGVCWAGTQWIAVGNGTNTFATSSNGLTWSGGGTSIFSTQGNAVAWNGSVAVAVGSGTNTIAYSLDSGSTWTGLGTSIFSTAGLSIAWNGTYWIAGGEGTNTTAYSTDGINWTANGSTIITTRVSGVGSTSPGVSKFPNIGFTPNSDTDYKILTTTGLAFSGTTTTLVDLTKKWRTNQWVGKRVLLTTGGTNIAGFELTVSSNTATQLTFSSGATSAISSNTCYTIIDRPVVSTGHSLNWNYLSTDSANKGRFLISQRGGGAFSWDIYNIATNRWDVNLFSQGIGENSNSGNMYVYDEDRIYFIVTSTSRIFYYDFVKNIIEPFGTIPYGMSGGLLGNRMAIIKTEDGLKYLYIIRHSGQEMWRTLIYY